MNTHVPTNLQKHIHIGSNRKKNTNIHTYSNINTHANMNIRNSVPPDIHAHILTTYSTNTDTNSNTNQHEQSY